MGMTLVVWCGAIVAFSILGGRLPDRRRLSHRSLQMVMSFVGGLMLGIGLLHLLPHAYTRLGSIDETAQAMLIGMLVMFLMLRAFHFHEHEPLHPPHSRLAAEGGSDEDHAHAEAQCSVHHAREGGAHRLSWTGVFFGLSLHTLIDGVALGAAVKAEGVAWGGVGVFFAILLHKPLDAVSITSLMTAGGASRGKKLAVNVLFALMCPLGAVLFLGGVRFAAGIEATVVGTALAFSAGVFLCISLSDLLPEIEFHTHDSLRLFSSLIAGILLAWLIGWLEPGQWHGSRVSQEPWSGADQICRYRLPHEDDLPSSPRLRPSLPQTHRSIIGAERGGAG